jgi:hypothetical protein
VAEPVTGAGVIRSVGKEVLMVCGCALDRVKSCSCRLIMGVRARLTTLGDRERDPIGLKEIGDRANRVWVTWEEGFLRYL